MFSHHKTKVFLGFFAVVAVVSVLAFFDTFNGVKFRVGLPSSGSDALAIDTDTDNDGLSDTSESYWNTDFQDSDTDRDGFKDGEEVLSGHSPIIAGPDDKISRDNQPQNITQKLGGLVLGGLTDGSLRSNNPNYNTSLNALVDEALLQYSTNAGDLPVSAIQTVADSPENIKKYKNSMKEFLLRVSEDIVRGFERMVEAAKGSVKDSSYDRYAGFLSSENNKITSYIHELEQIPAPEEWVIYHRRLVEILGGIAKNYELILKSDYESDPIQGMVAYSVLNKLVFQDFTETINTYSKFINSQK